MTHTGEVRDLRDPAPPRRAAGHAVRAGASFGSALAIAISWSEHRSIIWAIIHGIFSWLYVIWYALTRTT